MQSCDYEGSLKQNWHTFKRVWKSESIITEKGLKKPKKSIQILSQASPCPFTDSLNKCSANVFYVPGAVLDTEDTMVYKQGLRGVIEFTL